MRLLGNRSAGWVRQVQVLRLASREHPGRGSRWIARRGELKRVRHWECSGDDFMKAWSEMAAVMGWIGLVTLGGGAMILAAETLPGSGVSKSAVVYEVALVDKSLAGGWRGEREFLKHAKETLGVDAVQRFKPNEDRFRDWLERDTPVAVKLICLIDGWTSADLTRVDVRGQWNGRRFKRTIEVEDRDWRGALAQARRYVESEGP